MAYLLFDRVKETSTTTGTGDFTLAGTSNTYRRFSSVYSVGDTFPYAIQHTTLDEFETGVGSYSATNTLTRTTVQSSSNSNSAVSFSAGNKDVFVTVDSGTFISIFRSDRISSPQTINSASFANVSNMSFSIGGNEVWVAEFNLSIVGTTNGVRFQFTTSATEQACVYIVHGTANAVTSINTGTAGSSSTAIGNYCTSAATGFVKISLLLISQAATPLTVNLQCATSSGTQSNTINYAWFDARRTG